MGGRTSPDAQADLLDWQPPQPVVRFEDVQVRSASIAGRIAKAIAAALVGKDREQVALAMTDYLGRAVSKAMLDAYASAARDDHVISMPRFVALLQATGDRRLLELLAEPLGWAVIPRRFLGMIELAALQEQRDELARRSEALRRQVRKQGVL